jgi:hypothetical protein
MWAGLGELIHGKKPAQPAVVSLPAEPVEIALAPEPAPNWDEEARIDLPMRTPAQIQWLLKFETPEQTAARTDNDHSRYIFSRSWRAVDALESHASLFVLRAIKEQQS